MHPNDRNSPNSISLVTPVWGKEFCRVFCELVVPTLLAEGNIPTLAKHFQTTVHIYTSKADKRYFDAHPNIERLNNVAPVRFQFTEDLTVSDKYEMLNNCYNHAVTAGQIGTEAFVFCNADMVYSAQALKHIVELIQQGYRCVEIEGFRVDKSAYEFFSPQFSRDNSGTTEIPNRELVRFALDNMHGISKMHIWKPPPNLNYMPFHTYFPAGPNGLLAKASHIYPLYVFPRKIIQAEKSIDWDLVDQAGFEDDEKHIICDSNQLFACELSDPTYTMQATYPDGCGVSKMRAFVGSNCNEFHRERLGTTILFDGGGLTPGTVKYTRFYSWLWYRAVAKQSELARALFALLHLKYYLRNAGEKIAEFAKKKDLIASWYIRRILGIHQSPLINESVFQARTRLYAAPYFELLRRIEAVAPDDSNALEQALFDFAVGRSTQNSLETIYRLLVRTHAENLNLQNEIVVLNDDFIGFSWARLNEKQHLDLPLDSGRRASVFLEVDGMSFNEIRLSFIIDGRTNHKDVVIYVNQHRADVRDLEVVRGEYQFSFVVPPQLDAGKEGDTVSLVPLEISLGYEGRVRKKQYVRLISAKVYRINNLTHGALRASGKDPALHDFLCSVLTPYKNASGQMPMAAAFDTAKREKWIVSLHQTLSDVDVHSLGEIDTAEQLKFCENFVGSGWGQVSNWGGQNFRSFFFRDNPTIFVKLDGAQQYRLTASFYSYERHTFQNMKISSKSAVVTEQKIGTVDGRKAIECVLENAMNGAALSSVDITFSVEADVEENGRSSFTQIRLEPIFMS